MDLLTLGLITGTGLVITEGLSLLGRKLDKTLNQWDKLELEKYKIVKKEVTNTGNKLIIQIAAKGTIADLESHREEIEKAFKCKARINDIPFSDNAEIELISKEIKGLIYRVIHLSYNQLLIGYDFRGEPIVADMLEVPHLLLTGLSGQGKTGMLRVMIKNLLENNNADIVLLNGFIDDYRGFDIRHISNHDNIKSFIQELLDDIEEGLNRDRALYVIFEELGKIKDKELIALTTKLLQYGRHDRIYLIGVIQTATKEELKFKSLFNARCTFKQLEESSYRVVLGCGIDDKLQKREFYLYTNNLYKGKTYDLDF